MKAIKEKLKKDALSYRIKPSMSHHNAIMERIKTLQPEANKGSLKWFYPFSGAALAVVLIGAIIINSINDINPKEALIIANNNNNTRDINMSLLVNNLNLELTNEIDQEHQAIIDDIKFLKTLVVL
jgi:hypothetical protein